MKKIIKILQGLLVLWGFNFAIFLIIACIDKSGLPGLYDIMQVAVTAFVICFGLMLFYFTIIFFIGIISTLLWGSKGQQKIAEEFKKREETRKRKI
jgi:hypothetical protein